MTNESICSIEMANPGAMQLFKNLEIAALDIGDYLGTLSLPLSPPTSLLPPPPPHSLHVSLCAHVQCPCVSFCPSCLCRALLLLFIFLFFFFCSKLIYLQYFQQLEQYFLRQILFAPCRFVKVCGSFTGELANNVRTWCNYISCLCIAGA